MEIAIEAQKYSGGEQRSLAQNQRISEYRSRLTSLLFSLSLADSHSNAQHVIYKYV